MGSGVPHFSKSVFIYKLICNKGTNIKGGIESMKTVRIIVILVLIFVLGAVIIQNREPVRTHFLFITIEMPHILLLLLTAAGGFALGLFVTLFKAFKLKE